MKKKILIIGGAVLGVLLVGFILIGIFAPAPPKTAAQPVPTVQATQKPAAKPTVKPIARATPKPTAKPVIPTVQPTTVPVAQPTAKPIIPTQAPTTVPVVVPTAKPTAPPVNVIVQNAGMLGHASTTYGFTGNSTGVLVKDDIGDGNLTNGLTVGEIHLECFDAQKALWTAHLNITEVLIQVSMNVVDQYGNASNQMVAYCDLTQATEQQFNWTNLEQDSAWQVYDNTFIASFLTS